MRSWTDYVAEHRGERIGVRLEQDKSTGKIRYLAATDFLVDLVQRKIVITQEKPFEQVETLS